MNIGERQEQELEQKIGGSWRDRAKKLKRELNALYHAYRDPRVPWYAKALGALVVAYALSPVDLIPDFIPIIGYVDDLILLPLGIALCIKLIPDDVMHECREKARNEESKARKSWGAAVAIIAIWLSMCGAILVAIAKRLSD